MRFLLALMLALLPACDRNPAADPGAVDGPDSATALIQLFEGMVARLQANRDPAEATAFIEGFFLEEPHFAELFTPEVTARVWPAYRDVVAAQARAEVGAVLLREVLENGRTEVKVEGVGPAWPAATTRGDQALLDAMRVKHRLYTVRLQKPGEALGVRLNGFVYLGGRWRALLKAYEHLDPPPAPEEEAPPTEAVAPATAEGAPVAVPPEAPVSVEKPQ